MHVCMRACVRACKHGRSSHTVIVDSVGRDSFVTEIRPAFINDSSTAVMINMKSLMYELETYIYAQIDMDACDCV